MSRELNILCVSGITWDGDYLKSTVELARELGKRHRILFVEAPPSPRRLDATASRLWRPEPDRDVLVFRPPPALPTQRLRPGRLHRRLAALDAERIALAIDGVIGALGGPPDVLLHAWNPALSVHWLGRFGQKADVYYSYDELSACPWKARHGHQAEARLVRAADAVIATSGVLAERHRLSNPNTVCIPNGVDFDLFQGAVPVEHPHPGPVVGYVGSVDSRVDVPLVARLARENPDWRVVVAGPTRDVDDSPLRNIPNLERLGPVSREALPALVHSFDVGLVPFVHSDFTRALCPLKIYDYLAAGIGVAATPFAPLEEVRDVVALGEGSTGLADAVRLELEASTARVRARREVAAAASWSARTLDFETILNRASSAKETTCPKSWSPAEPDSSVPTLSMP